jgi:hypothetical protein
MTFRLTNTLAMVLVVVGTLLSPLVTPANADGTATGIVTFTVINHPPVILDVTTNAAGDSVSLTVLVYDPDSLLDIDRVIVHVYDPAKNASLSAYQKEAPGFEWSRKGGSRTSPANCSASTGCWYEMSAAGWTGEYRFLAAGSQGEIDAKTMTGPWTFSFTINNCDLYNWGYMIQVFDRSGAASTANRSLNFTCT